MLTENANYKEKNDDLVEQLATCKKNLKRYQIYSISQSTKLHNLKRSVLKLKKSSLCYENIKRHPEMMNYYTGVSRQIFEWILEGLKDEVPCVVKRCSKADHLFLVLVKLKVGLANKDIAYRLNISFAAVSRVYRAWLPKLSKLMASLIIWPEKAALRKHLPKCFRRKYSKCVCIIDCTEIFIERPLNLNTRAQSWSNYKNHNTIKYLIAATPAGAVSFLSDGWGGRVSDKEITIKSGFLDLIEHGDQILADRGFTVQTEIATHGGILVMPSFTKGKSQLSAKEVDKSREIANVRIHIERVIGRLRKYNILNTIIPITQADLVDNMMVAVAGLVNLNPSVVV